MAKRYFYQCVYQCDVAYAGPDQRRENWIERGRGRGIPTYAFHPIRLQPEHGMRPNGRPFPADYICTPRAVGKSYTEQVEKEVSRPVTAYGGARKMRTKVSKIKLELVDERDIPNDAEVHDYGEPVFIELTTEEVYAWQRKGRPLIKNKAGKAHQQIKGWAVSMFDDGVEPVTLPSETQKLYEAGRLEGKKEAVEAK